MEQGLPTHKYQYNPMEPMVIIRVAITTIQTGEDYDLPSIK